MVPSVWLPATSSAVGDGLMTVSQWSRVVLLLSVLAAVRSAVGAASQVAQPRKPRVVGVSLSLPIPPVVLTVAEAGRHLP